MGTQFSFALTLVAALAGCAATAPGEAVRQPEYAVVRVLFATDRNVTGSSKPAEMFGGEPAPALTYGVCEVSIPRTHKTGELEAPSIWRLEFRRDPNRHVLLMEVGALSEQQFFGSLAKRIARSSAQDAFVFVHGYNVTFEDAARRTAQIAYDLSFAGAPLFYSWPSRGSPLAYTVDEDTIQLAELRLASFLENVLTRTEAKNVHLIAHSMGTRALTGALRRLHSQNPSVASRLKEIVLVAPDINAALFKSDIAPALSRMERPITLYASSQDTALVASKKFHGYERAGDAGNVVIVSGIETIDATAGDTSFLGHSHLERPSVLADMFYLFREGKRADQRFGLLRVESGMGRYWEFRP